jgi:hypothetical protein
MNLKLKGCVYTHTEIQIPEIFRGNRRPTTTGTHDLKNPEVTGRGFDGILP